MTILSLMFFLGIIAFLLGVLILVAKAFGEFIIEMASAVARSKLSDETVGGKVITAIGWLLLVGGALSATISSVGYVLKWLGLV